jgi:SAM-dependent methyltransferase
MSRAHRSRSAYIEHIIRKPTTQENEKRRKRGAVYTPSFLAQFVATKAISYLLEDFATEKGKQQISLKYLKGLRFIDPACGDGELLYYLWQELIAWLNWRNCGGRITRKISPAELLCGLDIDAKAISKTRRRIARLNSHTLAENNFKLISTNALFPFNRSTHKGWGMTMRQFDAKNGFDIVIANPPWGADTTNYRSNLLNGDFVLRKGQFDTSDLFLELAMNIVKPGGILAFIIPDSVFNRERIELRRLLLDSMKIELIARLGEKVFDNVNRGCAVVICKKAQCEKDSQVECFHLTPEIRRRILTREMTILEAQGQLGYTVPQRRFIQNAECRFDIDTTADEQKVIDLITKGRLSLRDFLVSARGMELSKTGRICHCKTCNLWMPTPTLKDPKCIHCKTPLSNDRRERSIVTNVLDEGLFPLLVGETVTRYLAIPKHWVEMRVQGINFKDTSLYRDPKIVIRKTGVGISAAIDLSGAITNQVVYILRLRDSSIQIPLEVFLAVLNSRLMYYYLVKTHGEIEWRSHPYLTQTQILDFPMPKANWTHSEIKKTIVRITYLINEAIRIQTKLTPDVDAEIEKHVALLFGLTKNEYRIIYKTLDNVEQLLPVRELRRFDMKAIFSD